MGENALSYDFKENEWKILAKIPHPPKEGHGLLYQQFVKDIMTCTSNQDKQGNL